MPFDCAQESVRLAYLERNQLINKLPSELSLSKCGVSRGSLINPPTPPDSFANCTNICNLRCKVKLNSGRAVAFYHYQDQEN